MGAAAYALSLLTELPSLIASGKQVVDLIQTGTTALKSMQAENRDPTPAEWDSLNAQIKALQEELHAP
jgi:hypothetical protein